MFASGGGQISAKYLRATVISIALAISFSLASPSLAAGASPDRSAVGTHGMVVSESAEAANAGVEILKRGGNAIDAAVAVPGEIAGIDAALRRFGTMKFSQIAAPAIKLAEDGFPASPHLAGEIAMMAAKLKDDPGLRETFLKPDGTAPKAGDTIVEKNLAATLKALDDDPVANFYHGEIAAAISAFMNEHGGLIGTSDLANYRPIWRNPIHRHYEGYDVYTMPPPSSGGVVLEMLGVLETGHLAGLGINSPPYLARLIEVMRQGFIDRAQYADPGFVGVQVEKLLSDSHIVELRSPLSSCGVARCTGKRRRRRPPRTIMELQICWSPTRTATSSRSRPRSTPCSAPRSACPNWAFS